MSRPIPHDQETSLERIADAATRIADTLDDYMDMSLAGIELAQGIHGDEGIDAMIEPMVRTLKDIRERRSRR